MRFRWAVLSFVFLLNCSGNKSEDVTLVRFWAFGGTPKLMLHQRERVDLFNREHPQIRVELSQKSWEQKRELIHANFSAGTGPDVVQVHANYAAEFGDNGYFYRINTFADFDSVKEWYLPNLIESTRYKENYYGLPGNAIAFVLICNGELFDEIGVQPPKTWSEFRQAAKTLTRDRDGDGNPDQYGLTLMGGDRGGFEYRMAPFILKAGGRFLSSDLKRSLVADDIHVAVLQLFADMYQIDHSIAPGFLGYTITDVTDQIAGNKAAMSIEGPWYPSLLTERKLNKKIYIVPVPVPDTLVSAYHRSATLQDLCMLAMNSATKHPQETWELVKYMRNPEADMCWVKEDFGALPVTRAALNYTGEIHFPNLALFKQELEFAVPWPKHPQMIAMVSNIIAPYSEKAIIGEMGIREALQVAEREMQAILEDQP